MFEFLLGYWLGSSDNSSVSEHPRYFRESPPRELTREEKVKSYIAVIMVGVIIAIAIISYNEILARAIQLMRTLR